MKNLLFSGVALFVVVIAFSSCAKDQVCACTLAQGTVVLESATTFAKVSKRDAGAMCNQLQTVSQLEVGSGAVVRCAVK